MDYKKSYLNESNSKEYGFEGIDSNVDCDNKKVCKYKLVLLEFKLPTNYFGLLVQCRI